MSRDRLFAAAAEPVPRSSGPSAIEHVPTVDRCPRCTATIHEQTVWEDALLYHGGHGATRRTVTRSCGECHWFTTVEVAEERPPKGSPP